MIARWLGKQANLLPKDDEADTRAMEAMEYAVGTMHGQDLPVIPHRALCSVPVGPRGGEGCRARGRREGVGVLDKALAGKNYVAGEFSPADTALFYVEFWAAKRLDMKLPANVAAHYDRMMARPSVQRVMKQEGLN